MTRFHIILLTSCDGLPQRNEIRAYAYVVLVGEVFASSSKSSLDLVAYEQDVVFPAKILSGLEVSLWWNPRSSMVSSHFLRIRADVSFIPCQPLDGLDHECRDSMATLFQNLLEILDVAV